MLSSVKYNIFSSTSVLSWRPDIFEQFIKRGVRYGNQNPVVRIYTYGTTGVKGSTGFDPFILGHIKRKDKMRSSLLSKDMTERRLEEENDSPAFSYAQLEALLTGDDRIMDLCQMEADLEIKLQLIRAMERDIDRMKRGDDGIRFSRDVLDKQTRWLSHHATDFELAAQHIEQGFTAANFALTIQVVPITKPLDAAKAFAELATQLLDNQRFDQWLAIGAYGGFDILMMATAGRRVLMALRGKRRYSVNFTQNPYTFAHDRRLQVAYEAILTAEREAQQVIAFHTQRLVELEQIARAQTAALITLRLEAQALALGLLELRQVLGCTE